MTWDFSSAGWQSGIKSFFVSLGKFVIAVAAAAIAKQLLLEVNFIAAHLNTSTDHYGLFLGLTAVARSVISGFSDWVTTYSANNPAPLTDPVIDNPSGLSA